MARATEKYGSHRGDVRALAARGSELLFVIEHPEGQPTALVRFDVGKGNLKESPLPCGGLDLLVHGARLFVAGADGSIHVGPAAGGKLEPLGEPLDPAPTALAALADDLLAILSGATVQLRSRDGALRTTLELPEPGTSLVASPDGRWLVAGTRKGQVAVFSTEDSEDGSFAPVATATLHEGAVTALLFVGEELRFLSAGLDRKLLLTHVRGLDEPEDRAGRRGHGQPVRCLLPTDAGFLSIAEDGEVKTWKAGKRASKTSREQVGRPAAAARIAVHDRPHLAVAGADGNLRVFLLDDEATVQRRTTTLRDGWARATHEQQVDPKDHARRRKALDLLASWNDGRSIELLARATRDDDPELCLHAAKLLGRSGNAAAAKPLEKALRSPHDAVGEAAFAGLKALVEPGSLRPWELALAAGREGLGEAALADLLAAAGEDERSRALLLTGLDAEPQPVRFATVEALEKLLGDGPEGDLAALAADRADVRSFALARLLQRKLLDRRSVRSALRRATGDDDGDVRLRAFDLCLLARPKLADALRHLDKDLHRRLFELQNLGKELRPGRKLPKTKKVASKALDDTLRAPLLEAMASRALDTCTRGAEALAWLGDGRAFGALLQLSREQDEATRVAACKALEKLGDPRAVRRLRGLLRDGELAVRDAAFTALSRILGKAPLDAAAAGLEADHEDVRRRGLRLLTKQLKADRTDPAALALLGRALDDSSEPVRSEAFKATLNLDVGGDAEATLRFALSSMHADVRSAVLTEVMARFGEDWAWPLLAELFDDADAELRAEAFAFALKKAKKRGLEPHSRALASRHIDQRSRALAELVRKVRPDTVPLLVGALSDDNPGLRFQALEALRTAEADEAVAGAMTARHADIRIRAAVARAAVGDPAALRPLLEQLAEPRPEVGDLEELWRQRVAGALEGLTELEDPAAIDAIRPLVDHDHADVRRPAARALAWTVAPDRLDLLRPLLHHEDDQVRLAAARGLAWLGDPAGATVLFPLQAPSPSSSGGGAGRRAAKKRVVRKKAARRRAAAPAPTGPAGDAGSLICALTLGRDDALFAFLDAGDDSLRRFALRLVLLREWRAGRDDPDGLLAALAAARPDVRQVAAAALEARVDAERWQAFVVEQLNDRTGERGASEPWTITADDLAAIADLLEVDRSRLRVRAATLLRALHEREQDRFDLALRRLRARFGDELAAAAKVTAKKKRRPWTAEEAAATVFGTWVALSRLRRPDPLRRTSLLRLEALHAAGLADAEALAPVFVQALSDDRGFVRQQAFASLQAIGFEPGALAAEALATSASDVGVLGLTLLSSLPGGGDAVLEEALLARTDGLESEAARLLAESRGWPAVHALGLAARSEDLRRASLHGLSGLYGDSPEAADALRGALASPFPEVVDGAATALGAHRDPAAWEPLLALLASSEPWDQRRAIEALTSLGDPRTPGRLLDRLDDDPSRSADADALLRAAGDLRDASITDRLLERTAERPTRTAAFGALATVSGYDQSLSVDFDSEEPDADLSWLDDQHPRRDDVLARLLESAHALGETRLLRRHADSARWARGDQVDAPLALMATSSDDGLRDDALTAIGWRLRFRDGPAEPLVTALEHKNAGTQLIAAEALAWGGRDEGIQVLLAAIDLQDDHDLRCRAVTALGRLADERALTVLLTITEQPDHALIEPAAEAIGHLARGDQREPVLRTLKRLCAGEDEIALRALTGLRWFGSPEA